MGLVFLRPGAFKVEAAGVSNCHNIQDLIRLKTGSYNKSKLRRDHYQEGSAAEAILRSERLDTTVLGGDIKSLNAATVPPQPAA